MLLAFDELIINCPYSPDLSPNDFFSFPGIKCKIYGTAVEGFRPLVTEVAAPEWKNYFENWFERMQNYIDLNGSILHVFFYIICRNISSSLNMLLIQYIKLIVVCNRFFYFVNLTNTLCLRDFIHMLYWVFHLKKYCLL